jgi:proline racemase
LAVLHARQQIRPGETFIHESLIGSRFHSRIESLTRVGEYDAVVPSVAGQAWITDMSQVGLDPTDPFPLGYTLSDSRMGGGAVS